MAQTHHDSTEKETIEDPDGHFRKRRGDAVLDVRDRVYDQRRKALDMLAKGQIGEDFAAYLVRQAVEDYVYESEHVIRGYLPESDEESVEAPVTRAIENLQDTAHEVWNTAKLGAINTHPSADDYPIIGVKGYMQAPNPVRIRFAVNDSSPVGGTAAREEERTYQIPIDVSMNAFSEVNRFWNEFGMDVNPDDELDAFAEPY